MMILVPRQGRPASEGLLAVHIRALVGTLSRVDPAMTRKRTAVAKGLYDR